MFDNRTLLIEGLIIPLSFLIMLLLEFGWSKKQAVKSNILANLFQFLASILFLMRNSFSNFFTFGISHILFIISSILILVTTFSLFNVKVSLKKYINIGLAIFLLMMFFVYIIKNKPLSYLTISLGISSLYVYGIIHLIYRTTKNNKKLISFFIFEFLLVSIASFSRSIFYKYHYDILENNIQASIYIISTTLFILLWNYTVQLKRNSIFQNTIEKNNEKILQIQEDLFIVNNAYFETVEDSNNSELFNNIFSLLHERFSIYNAAIYLYENEELTSSHFAGFSENDMDKIGLLSGDIDINNLSYSKNIVSEIYVGELENSDFKTLLLRNRLIGAAAFPLFIDGRGIGSMFVGITSISTIINRDREIFLSICRQIAGVLYSAKTHSQLLETQEKLKKMASIDQLTGIYNRREFLKQFKGEFNSSIRHHDMFTIFIADLDDFKSINNLYGNDIGDTVLTNVSGYIRHHLRSNDLFARYGGKEFIGVLLRSELEGTYNKLNKMVENVSKIKIPNFPDLKVSISIGSCSYNSNYEDIESMIKKADIALCEAKKSDKKLISLD